jgi:hypothetical protein
MYIHTQIHFKVTLDGVNKIYSNSFLGLFNDAANISDSSNDRSQLEKDLEGRCSVLIDVLFQHLPGGTDENYENLWSE